MNETFKEYLQNQNLSQNTIISYTSTLEQYHNQFHTFTRKNLREYKYFLMGNLELYSKGGKLRRIYIPARLQKETLQWLSEENRQSGFIFLNKHGERITSRGIAGQLKHFAVRYGLDPSVVYPHSFRHRFAKSFLERYNDIAMLADLMGHESIETTRSYLRKTSTEQKTIINQIVDW